VARYVVGDIQGCFDSLVRLLERAKFDARRDELWCVGDLVNRGPKSLEVLRFVMGLGTRAKVVLGNHDLYLLMVSAGFRKRGKDDTVQAILDAPDASVLLDWMASQPLMHVDGNAAMVHAGLLPQWDVRKAHQLANEVGQTLKSEERDDFLANLAGNSPTRWDDALTGQDRLRCIVNAMTRMRFCTPDGEMEFRHKGPPSKAPVGALPWFEVPGRQHGPYTLFTGHWSALGLRVTPAVVSLDTGCLWGGALTAWCLETAQLYQVPSAESSHPDPLQ